jgi:phosphatidate cytidylyltransferase
LKNFTQRTITGLLYVAVIIASVYLHPLAFILVFTVIMVLAMAEFYRLITTDDIKPQVIMGIGTGIVMLASTFFIASGILPLQILSVPVLLIFLLFFFELFHRNGKLSNNLAYTCFGLIYVSLPLSLLPFLGYPRGLLEGYTPDIILGYLILLWIYDTGAYIVGSFTGRHKIMENISPAKSWEGFFSGLIISIGVAFAVAELFPVLNRTDWIIIAALTVVTGTLGDFFESGLKRNAGVKDSGNLLPGHGGMLDRIDSVLLSVPFVFIFLLIRQFL